MLINENSHVNYVTAIPSVVTNSVAAATASQLQSQGESQNALLKQLLQNTGCASMTQTSENVGFSLTSCLPVRPVIGQPHTTHLSEAATRIPHPPVRPPTPATPTAVTTPPLPRTVIKTEPMLTDGGG